MPGSFWALKKLPGITFLVVLALSFKIIPFFFFQKVFRAKPPKPMHVAETSVPTTRLYATLYEKQEKAKDLARKHQNHRKSNEKQ